MGSAEERIQPQNLEAEQCLIGSLLLDSAAMHEVDQKVESASFYLKKHQTLFKAIQSLTDEAKPVDAIILREELGRKGLLEEVGGPEYLLELAGKVPSSANAEYYADIVREKALLRGFIGAASEILRKAYDPAVHSDELSVVAEQEIFRISQGQTTTATPIHKILGPVFSRILAMRDRNKRISGVGTGYFALDDITSGMQEAQLIVVAGRPSMGKTSFALNVVEHVAIKETLPVLIFSLEMQGQQLAQNMICSHARIDAHRVRKGTVTEEEKARLVETATGFSSAPIYIDDSSSLTVNQIRSRARRFHMKEKLSLIVVDYMQLIEVRAAEAGSRFDNRQTEISYISRSLKAMSRELKVPVMALSQLNREVEKRTDHRPMLADLRECVTGDTLVCLADGRRLPISELVGARPEVVSFGANGKLARARADLVWRVGRKKVLKVRLASGRSLRVTGEHRLMGPGGWVHAKNLVPGDRLAIARRLLPPRRAVKWPEARVALQGQRIGDGSYLSGQPMRMASMRGTSYGGAAHFRFAPSRATLAEYADLLDHEGLRAQASSDLFWDRVVAVERCGTEEVFDLTVPGTACWLADGVLSHNSGAIEQDADLVMLLHRPGYYKDATKENDTDALVIIAKQRSGPVGDVQLTWRKEYTRFDNPDFRHGEEQVEAEG